MKDKEQNDNIKDVVSYFERTMSLFDFFEKKYRVKRIITDQYKKAKALFDAQEKK